MITVVVPEFVLDHWWEQALHNQSALMLKARLRDRPNTAILSVPVQVGDLNEAPSRRFRTGEVIFEPTEKEVL